MSTTSKASDGEPIGSRPHMPGYGLPSHGEGLMPWSWAEERLAKSHNYWIGTTRPDGRPHLMVIWGLWLERVFYFSTGSESRKALNLSLNAHCVIGTEQAEQAVVLEGTAERVTDVTLLKSVLAIYARKYDYDMSSMEADILGLKEPVYAVRPRVAFGLDEKATLQNMTRWRFRSE